MLVNLYQIHCRGGGILLYSESSSVIPKNGNEIVLHHRFQIAG